MNCLNKAQICDFLSGRMSASRMLEIDDHLSSCNACKDLLASSLVTSGCAVSFADHCLGLDKCPEYEQLSALLDSVEVSSEMNCVRYHVASCASCTEAIAAMSAVRARASLGGELAVRPGRYGSATKRQSLGRLIAVGSACAVLVIGIAFSFSHRGNAPRDQVASTANTRSDTNVVVPAPGIDEQTAANVADSATLSAPNDVPTTVPARDAATKSPSRRVNKVAQAAKEFIKDGGYALVRKDGRLVLARRNGSANPDQRMESLVAQKLKTGGVERSPEYVVAMNTIYVRSSDLARSSGKGPELMHPVNTVVRSVIPTFKWSKVDMAEAYRFVLTDESGQVLFEQVTPNNWMKPNLSLGRGELYFWMVGMRYGESDDWTNSKASGVKILSDEGLAFVEQVERDYLSSSLARGVAYESVGLLDEADAEYQNLQNTNPNSEIAARIRSGVAIDGQ